MVKKELKSFDSLNNVFFVAPNVAAKRAAELPRVPDDRVAYAIVGTGLPEQCAEAAETIGTLSNKGYKVILRYLLWSSEEEYHSCGMHTPRGAGAAAAKLAGYLKSLEHHLPHGGKVDAVALGSDFPSIDYRTASKSPERVVQKVWRAARGRMPALGHYDESQTGLVIWLPELKIRDLNVFVKEKAHILVNSCDNSMVSFRELEDLGHEDFCPVVMTVISTNDDDKLRVVANAVGWSTLALLDLVVPFFNLTRQADSGKLVLTSKHMRLIADVFEPMVSTDTVAMGNPSLPVFNVLAFDEDSEEMFLLLLNPSDGHSIVVGEKDPMLAMHIELDLLDLEQFGIESAVPPEVTLLRTSHEDILAADKTLTLPPGSFCVLRLFAQGICQMGH